MGAPPPSGRLDGRHALVTMADRYTGPAVIDRFRAEGATVIEDTDSHLRPDGPQAAVDAAGPLDILVVNLVARWRPAPPTETTDERWLAMFDVLVHPTMRFVRAVLPHMIARRSGKIIVVTSAAPLRATPQSDAYSAARAAQNAYVQAVGADVARHNVQVNAIAQAYVESVDAFQRSTWDSESIQRQLRHVPAGRIAESWEQAELVTFLASRSSDFIAGQIVAAGSPDWSRGEVVGASRFESRPLRGGAPVRPRVRAVDRPRLWPPGWGVLPGLLASVHREVHERVAVVHGLDAPIRGPVGLEDVVAVA
jgi:2-keto-3-deoxy-L-fuconate dehydrogenase